MQINELTENVTKLAHAYTTMINAHPPGVTSGYEFDGLRKAINAIGDYIASEIKKTNNEE